MKFSLIYELEMPKPWTSRTEYETYWEALAQAQLADELGFDTVWEVEHHFLVEYSHSSAPEVFLSALSQRTKNVRLGHGVTLLPFPYNHPIRAAERAAALDIVSNGRLEFGSGRSVTEVELGGFQIDPEETREMCEEGLEVIVKAWTTDPLEHAGKRLKIPPRSVIPKPIQKPHPPLWMAATGPTSFEMAGERGLGALCFNFAWEQAQRSLDLYRQAVAHAQPVGHFVKNEFAQFLVVNCSTDQESLKIGLDAARWFFHKIEELFVTLVQADTKSYSYLKDMFDLSRPPQEASDEELLEHPAVIVGDPERCIRKLEPWYKMGIDQAICLVQFGRLPHQQIMDSLRLIGRYVMPHFSPGRAA